MTREEAEKYAENMTYREAIHNLKQAKSIPYRKATFIKVNELLKALEQEPKTGYLSIDDVMSVFDDFMCGEVDEEGTETFLEMLKDKAESEAEDGKDI